MKVIKDIILFLWQLPQNILGLLLMECYDKTEKFTFRGKNYQFSSDFPGGISLGNYVIVGTKDDNTLNHEYGHCVQSLWFGPLYLIIVGIPSVIRATLVNYSDYYSAWPENSADKLGGVKRG